MLWRLNLELTQQDLTELKTLFICGGKNTSYSMPDRKRLFFKKFRKSHIHKGVMLFANNIAVYMPDIPFCSLFSLFLKAFTISLGHSKTILIFLMGRLMRKLSIKSAVCMPHKRKDVYYTKIYRHETSFYFIL